MLASPGSQFNFSCTLCPRTFKLQEFYDKHLKVHQLKKQHVCTVCGFVYGAAKGLEGHMDSAHPEPLPPTHSNTPPVVRRIEQPEDLSTQMLEKMPEMPFFHFLHAQGALSPDIFKQAQQAMLAQMTQTTKNLSLVPISITAPASPSPTGSLSQKPNDKSKIPSPAGTGNYKIYGESRSTHPLPPFLRLIILTPFSVSRRGTRDPGRQRCPTERQRFLPLHNLYSRVLRPEQPEETCAHPHSPGAAQV